jgi:hypothetical protein
MELLHSQDVASVVLFDLRLSEGEVQTVADALKYVLETLDVAQIQTVFTDEKSRDLERPEDTREFVQDMFVELMDLIRMHCRLDLLPQRFLDWM